MASNIAHHDNVPAALAGVRVVRAAATAVAGRALCWSVALSRCVRLAHDIDRLNGLTDRQLGAMGVAREQIVEIVSRRYDV